MKRRYLISILIFGFVLALFLAQKTYAQNIYKTQPDYSGAITGINNPSPNGWALYDNTSATFTSSGSAVQIHYKLNPGLIFNDNQVYTGLYGYYDNANWHPLYYNGGDALSATSFANESKYCFTTGEANQMKDIYLNFPNGGETINFYSGHTYAFYILTVYNANGTVCANTNGVGVGSDHNNTLGADATNSKIYYQIGSDLTINNSVSINTIATSTQAAQQFQWQYHLDSAATYLGIYTIFPQWSLYKCDNTGNNCNTDIGDNLGTNFIPQSNIATGTTSGFNLDNGYYQVKNFYLEYDSVGQGNITASTSMVNSNVFNVNYSSSYIPTYNLPTSTISSSTPIQITCDPNSGFISYSICSLLVSLFVPSQSVLNQFSNLTTNINTKPPIGYFTAIMNAVGSLTSTTPAFTISVDSTDPVNTTFFSPIRIGLAWILWLAFGFWVFHRFRHFHFTNP